MPRPGALSGPPLSDVFAAAAAPYLNANPTSHPFRKDPHVENFCGIHRRALVLHGLTGSDRNHRIGARPIVVNDKPESHVKVALQGEDSLLRTTTDTSGNYVFSQVPFGNYTLSAVYPGVAEKKIPIQVASDQVLTINFALGALKTIGSASVSARAARPARPFLLRR